MLISRRTLKEHLIWIVIAIAVTAGSIFLYTVVVSNYSWEQRPRGSQLLLFLYGIAGGGICLFEFLLWPRKKLRTYRFGRTKVWMKLHIWLGLMSVPLLILHSGFWFKNLEATILIILFGIVILSGIWGLTLQQFIPQKMLGDLPAETIYSQIDYVSNLLVKEADRLVLQTCGPTEGDQAALLTGEEEGPAEVGGHFTVGAVRVVGGTQGKVLESRAASDPIPNSEALRAFFNQEIKGFLRQGAASGMDLANPIRARGRFDELRTQVDPRAHPAVETLESMCDQRRQFDKQVRLHNLLHNWLAIHLPLSAALIILMFVHIYVTLQRMY